MQEDVPSSERSPTSREVIIGSRVCPAAHLTVRTTVLFPSRDLPCDEDDPLALEAALEAVPLSKGTSALRVGAEV